MHAPDDPYHISTASQKEAPHRLVDALRFLGPGFILSASIVGSGELIATTVLGAKAGFSALWIILASCLVKVTLQVEFGKHAILTGETPMHAFSKLPGANPNRGGWAVWITTSLTLLKIVQLGGIVGGSAVVLNMLFPAIPLLVCALIVCLSASVMIFNGKYGMVEKISLVMIGLFTLLTLTAVFSIAYTPYHFDLQDVISSLRFRMSGEIVGVAIGAFGITGVAADEIIAYNYWCLEKGYASYTGPRVETEEWKQRAKGWINVMYLDATVAMLIYTAVTVAFYLLGAAVLHQRGEIPVGNQVIETLALVYTQTLGPGVKTAYLVGGFFVLYSSVYASLAAWTRLFSDAAGRFRWIDFNDPTQRRRCIALLAWAFPLLWFLAYVFINLPVIMVLSGGVVGSLLLWLVAFAGVRFRYTTQQVASSTLYDIAFWISVVSILFVGIYGVVSVII